MRTYEPLSSRFEKAYIPEPNTGCWLWTGKLDTGGYGVVTDSSKTFRAHRVSYAITHGAMPTSSMDVCHRCDVRACVNPDHLFLGTRKDNIQDCWRKGRGVINARRTDGAGLRTLTAAEVREIRASVASGVTQARAASRFSISAGHVSMIVNRKLWAWLA